MMSRPGNPLGSASAAARLTTPRIPAQDSTVTCASGGIGSCLASPGNRLRGSQVAGNTQRNRLTISVPATARPSMTSRPAAARGSGGVLARRARRGTLDPG